MLQQGSQAFGGLTTAVLCVCVCVCVCVCACELRDHAEMTSLRFYRVQMLNYETCP